MDALAPSPPADPALAGRVAQVEALAEGLRTTLRLAGAMAAAGRRVDLVGLDRMTGLFCARLLDLPPAQGRALRPAAAALLAEFATLESALPPAA